MLPAPLAPHHDYLQAHHLGTILDLTPTLLRKVAPGSIRMATKLSLQSKYAVGEGAEMPLLGFGVYKSRADVTEQSVTRALKTGYRHIDSAQYYENERE